MRKPVIPILFLFFLLSVLCLPGLSYGSQPSAGKSKKHLVVKSDTWYSIAKKYDVSYADLRAANSGLSDNLHIGDSILIPGKKSGAETQKKNEKESKSPSAPGYHTVKAGENLTMIAKKYNVTVAEITGWNQLKTKSLKAGQKLKVKGKDAVPERAEAPVRPVTSTLAAAATDSMPAPVAHPESTATHVRLKDTATGKTGGKGEMIVPENTTSEIFAKGRKEITEEGAAAWIEDQEINPGKYFALHRTAPIGTIVKVTNRMNRRTVFVKVVGKLPDTGENENIVLKISKAAADKLGVMDARFQAQLNYGVDNK